MSILRLIPCYPRGMKTCSKCHIEKPLSEFNKHTGGAQGVRGDCKMCRARYRQGREAVEPVIVGTKTCSDCGQTKTMDQFHVRNDVLDGRRSQCILCRRKANRSWATENSEYLHEKNRQWREANAKSLRLYRKNYYSEYRARDIQHARAVGRAKSHVRRARIRDALCGCITAEWLDAVILSPCVYCGDDAEHRDHTVPLARGGTHCVSNIQPACGKCNRTKNDMALEDFLVRYAPLLDTPPTPLLDCPNGK